jgi:hypothetical protein
MSRKASYYSGTTNISFIHNQQADKKIARIMQCAGSGEVAWQRDLPMDRITAVASTNDKGIFVAGVCEGNIHFIILY